MLYKRLLTAAIGLPLVIGAVLAGRLFFIILLEFAIIMGAIEYSDLTENMNASPILPLLLLFSAGVPVVYLAWGSFFIVLWLLALVLTAVIWRLGDRKATWRRIASTVLGVIYIGVLLNFFAMIYGLRNGPFLVVVTLMATWVADTSAYAIGSIAGHLPLAPKISPNKTIEGAIGALIITSLVLGSLSFVPGLSTGQRLVFGFTIAIAALAGDLFESWLKRTVHIKDSGRIFPGHGGFLDRVDSLLFSGTAGYFILNMWVR